MISNCYIQRFDNKYNLLVGISTKIIVADFMDPNVLHRIVQELDQFNIDIGVLVNNVGMLGEHHMPFLELDLETVTGMINVNILAGTVLCHALLPKMKKGSMFLKTQSIPHQ